MLVCTTPKVLLLLTATLIDGDDFGNTKPSEQLRSSVVTMAATSVEDRDGATMMQKCSDQNPIAR